MLIVDALGEPIRCVYAEGDSLRARQAIPQADGPTGMFSCMQLCFAEPKIS